MQCESGTDHTIAPEKNRQREPGRPLLEQWRHIEQKGGSPEKWGGRGIRAGTGPEWSFSRPRLSSCAADSVGIGEGKKASLGA